MALLVFVADSCQGDAERHGQGSIVENLKASIEGSQNLTGFVFFPSTPFMKKTLGRSFRLIAYRVPFADNELILFLRILARGSNEYENFLANWGDDTPSITRQFQPYDSAQLQEIYAQLTSIAPPAQLPEPSVEERAWLYEVFRKTMPEDELLVLETEVWVRKMRAPENRDFLALYHQMIEQLGTDRLHAAASNTGIVTHWEDNRRLGVIYLYRPDLHRLLLLEPIRQSDDVNAVLAEHDKRLAQHYAELSDISRLEERVTAVVVDAALAEGDLSLAATMLDLIPDRDRVVKLLSSAAKDGDANITSAAAVLAARTFVRTRAWKSAIRAAEDTHFPELAGIQLEKVRSVLGKSNGVTDVFRAVVDELAVSEDLAAETSEQQAPVAEFLNKQFIGKGGPQGQAHVISPVVIGAAIERAGKIVDALQFYEGLGRQTSAGEEQKFAAERLVRNLERHAEYLRSRGDERQARQRQSRAQQLRERGRLGNGKLQDYPVVRAGVAHDGSTEWIRGPFKVVLSKSHERLRIEHAERFETVTLNWKDGILLGDAKFFELDRSGDESAAWAIEGWDATIKLVNGGNTVRVVASFGKEPFEIAL